MRAATAVTVRVLAVLTLVATVLLVPTAGSTPTNPARAADLSKFDPGNIISDAVFYDAWAMSPADVQAFLVQKGGNCTAGAMCLKNYTLSTSNRSGDTLCNGYQGAANESAAVVITKVSQSCGVSPRVLLVLLQKEMGLVTATSPTARRYERAAGYACPDSASGACDPAYAGLQNQLYRSAWQYKKYRAAPGNYGFVAGEWNTIPWSVNPSCGTSRVFIVNQATAGLYNYTPYRPNQNSLNAGYGASSDSCAQYGNRNFYNYFTDWFGSTGFRTYGAIGAAYVARGGGVGPLGAPTGEMYCGLTGGGCGQFFSGGVIYWSPATGARAVSGAIRDTWARGGWENSALGYPTGDMICGLVGGGCGQVFAGGAVYWSPGTGAHAVTGAIRAAWSASGLEKGGLGYPSGDMFCGLAGGGCGQFFSGGVIYWSPTGGAHALSGGILTSWSAAGWENGALSYPTGDMFCGLAGGGCGQFFAGGVTYWSPSTGAHGITGAIRDAWAAQGWEGGPLGYPTDGMSCPNGGCRQGFSGGFLGWTPAGGVRTVTGALATVWKSLGTGPGTPGYPVADQVCVNGGCYQTFGAGSLAAPTSGAVRVMTGAISDAWTAQGAGAGVLGYPTIDMVCGLAGSGCGQHMERGVVYWSSATGARAVSGAFLATWSGRGWENGELGYPSSDMTCASGGCHQQFEGGLLYWDQADGVRTVAPDVAAEWTSLGGAGGVLGRPTGDSDCTLPGDGCVQTFTGGTIVASPATGSRAVSGGIGAAWTDSGGATGPLGFPTTDLICGLRDGGCGQQFQHGALYWSPSTGVQAVTGAILGRWTAGGLEAGGFRYPTQPMVCGLAGKGCSQAFQGGRIVWSPTTGAHDVAGAIGARWLAQGGPGGDLGYPATDTDCGMRDGGCAQWYQDGAIYWSSSTGARSVTGAILTRWLEQSAEWGPLGYPTADRVAVNGGYQQQFQGGTLTWNTTTGAVTSTPR